MLQSARRLLELIRFSHTVFALPFALTSAVLAWWEVGFRWLDLLGVLVCMVFARSSAMAFNRLADRKIDALNPRTAQRHLPAGTLSVPAVWAFMIFCSIAFVLSTLLFVIASGNWLPLYLAVPVLGFLCLYSLTKRFTALCHVWLGASLMLAPLSAWIAIRGTIEWTPVLLGLAVLTWVAGFDILYACQDVDFDRRAKLHSIPANLGVARALLLAMLLHGVTILMLLALWPIVKLGLIYLVGVIAVAGLLAYEHWLVRPSDLTRMNLAFFHVNTVVSLGIFLVVLADRIWPLP